jgi:23S rRNA (uracil1939-C5)-methyltransferase
MPTEIPTEKAAQYKPNDILEITSLSNDGQGVGRLDQMVVFVDGAIPGDRIQVQILRQAKSYVIGKMIKIMKPSEDRIMPPCKVSERCGGCSLLHMSYPAQCKWKQDNVLEVMKRIGGFDRELLESIQSPILAMEDPWHYRNIVQLPVSGTPEHPEIGFYEGSTHQVVDTDRCLIAHPVCDAIRETVRAFICQNQISIYDEACGKGLLRHLVIRSAFRTGQVMVILVVNGSELPLSHQNDLKEALILQLKETVQKAGLQLTSVFVNLNDNPTNLVFGKKFIPLYGQETIEEVLCGIRYRISPSAFFQVNPVQAEILYQKVIEFAELNPDDTVFDLYCGTGSISLALAGHCRQVIGVESVPQAIDDAKENARQNEIHNAEFHVGKAEEVFPRFVSKGVHADVLVVDPPRKGLETSLIESIIKMSPPRIVYVSCSPATMARDCKILCENGGYQLKRLQTVDMFPWTGHIECVSLLTRIH